MLFYVALWRDEDGQVIAECPEIPGCVSQGADEDQAMNNIRAAIAECLEVRRQLGQPLTIEIRQVEVNV